MSCGIDAALMITARHLGDFGQKRPPGGVCNNEYPGDPDGGEAARVASVLAIRIFSKGSTLVFEKNMRTMSGISACSEMETWSLGLTWSAVF